MNCAAPVLARPPSGSLGLDEPSRDRLDDPKSTNARPFGPPSAEFTLSAAEWAQGKLFPLRTGPAQAQASLMLSIPNYLPSRQGKSLEFASLFNTIKSTPQIQTMRTYQNLGWSAAFLSAVFFADAFFVSTISIADFGHAAFGHSPVQQ